MHTESSNNAFGAFTTKEFFEVGMSKYILLAQKCCSVLGNCPGCHSFISKNVWNWSHLSSKKKNCRKRWQRWKITWRFLVPKIPFWSMIAVGSCNRFNYPNKNENLNVNIPVCWHGFAWNQWNNCQDCKDVNLNCKYRHHNLSATSITLLFAFFPIAHNVNLVFYSSLTSLLACNS